MANLDFYRHTLNINNLDELEQSFCNTLIKSNYTYSFFVDWEKVNKHRDAFRNELALLSSLKGVGNPRQYLRGLIIKYPEVVRVFPLLLAVRDSILTVLNIIKHEYKYIDYDFRVRKPTEVEIDKIVAFCDKTGLLKTLTSMESAIDYMTGVEVGLDSNARKNRSGNFMEDAVDEVLSNIVATNAGITRVSQKQFKYLQSNYEVSISPGLKERRFDEVIIKGEHGINMEINFYSRPGSKPNEIVDAYISKKNELDSMGWKFVWITDGRGWHKMKNTLRMGLEKFEYTLNLDMLQRGLLEEIILEE